MWRRRRRGRAPWADGGPRGARVSSARPAGCRVSSPVSTDGPPPACLRGGASHEAEGRRWARGGGAGRVGPPATRRRLGVLRQIGDELVPGLEEFLFVDNVVAVEEWRGSCGRSGAWRPARGRWRGSGCGRRCGGNRGGSGSARRPPDRRCTTPCASAGRGCLEIARRKGTLWQR